MTPMIAIQAYKLMERLEKHPCARSFMELEKMNNNSEKRFRQKVNEPMSIVIIKEKLNSMQYETVSQWTKDVKLICDNASSFYGRFSRKAILANELLRIFDKEFVKFVCYSITKWSKLFAELTHKIQFSLGKMPEDMKLNSILMASLNLNSSRESYEVTDEPVTTFKGIPDHEINCFLAAASNLSSIHDARAMASIISSVNPSYDFSSNEAEINLESLNGSTIRSLIEYTKKKFAELGLEYPKV